MRSMTWPVRTNPERANIADTGNGGEWIHPVTLPLSPDGMQAGQSRPRTFEICIEKNIYAEILLEI